MRKITRFFKLRWNRKLLLLEAVFLLGLCRLAILAIEFKKIVPHLGIHMNKSTGELDCKMMTDARNIRWAIRIMSKYTPWESKCFVQALAAKIMLRRRNRKSKIYFGVARDSSGKMIAHAWLECGGAIVTGAEGRERFTVVSIFEDR